VVRLTEQELRYILDVAERVARRTGQRVVVAWDRIEIVGQSVPNPSK
jgi:hypothetical protein